MTKVLDHVCKKGVVVQLVGVGAFSAMVDGEKQAFLIANVELAQRHKILPGASFVFTLEMLDRDRRRVNSLRFEEIV